MHKDIKVADLLVEPNEEVTGTWLHDVCIGDKVYALKSASDGAYSIGCNGGWRFMRQDLRSRLRWFEA